MKGSFVMLTADYIEKIAKFNQQNGIDPDYPGFFRDHLVRLPFRPSKQKRRAKNKIRKSRPTKSAKA